jgi:hypothetical protein
MLEVHLTGFLQQKRGVAFFTPASIYTKCGVRSYASILTTCPVAEHYNSEIGQPWENPLCRPEPVQPLGYRAAESFCFFGHYIALT